MCFKIISKIKPRVRIAKKDIVVWKKVMNSGNSWFWPEYEYTDGFVYYIGKMAYAENFRGKRINTLKLCVSGYKRWNIYEGIHSRSLKFYTKKGVVELPDFRWSLLKCIIPKGTEYYTNKGDYVSLKIKPIKAYSHKDKI